MESTRLRELTHIILLGVVGDRVGRNGENPIKGIDTDFITCATQYDNNRRNGENPIKGIDTHFC